MASPPRNDAWRPYKPSEQRLVFVRRGPTLKPWLGIVIQFPISGTGGRFLVAYYGDRHPGPSGLEIRSLARNEISPIRVDPNDAAW